MIQQRTITTTTGGQVFSGPLPNECWVICQNQTGSGPQQPPMISKHMEPCVGQLGGTGSFHVTLTGNPVPKVGWIKDGKPISPSAKYEMHFDSSGAKLAIKNLDANDAGNYFVVAENQFGRLQSGANLLFPAAPQVITIHQQFLSQIMMMPPLLIGAPQVIHAFQNQSAQIQIRLGTNPLPTVAWFKDGKPIQNGPKYQITSTADGLFTLIINQISPTDGGQYVCVATNPNGSNNINVGLNIKGPLDPNASSGPPVFVETFQNMILQPGHPIILHCRVAPNTPKPVRFQWSKDGTPLSPGQPYRITNMDFETTLFIDSPKPQDAGNYTCTATGPGGSASHPGQVNLTVTTPKPTGQRPKEQATEPPASRKIPMGVGEIPVDPRDMELVRLRHVEEEAAAAQQEVQKEFDAPKFLSNPADLNLVEGDKAHFECRYTPTADPKLTIVWMFQGKEIAASSRLATEADFGKATLKINGVYPEDTGKYSCVAKNLKGQAEVSANLNVTEDRGVVRSSLFGGQAAGSQSVDALERRLADPKKRDDNVGRPNWAVQRN